jgi:hypothetical protein
MTCKKCGSEMLDEFENIRGVVTITWVCINCEERSEG